MPLPNPQADESEQEFVSRCIGMVVGDGTVDNTPDGRGQAAAMCFSHWQDSKKSARTERAYSLLTIKSLNEEQRIISGIATTPQTDLMEDIVEPRGAQFSLPIPFLWQHDPDQPIGHVRSAKVTDKGIDVEVQLVKVAEPGKLKERLDEAWQSIKHGLVRGLSIGFKDKESEPIKGSNWGRRILKWSWLELSAVTIPANEEASILAIKKIDNEFTGKQAATGKTLSEEMPGDSGQAKKQAGDTARTFKVNSPKEATKMAKITTSERIANLEATRAANVAAMSKIADKVADEGRTKDAEEQQQFDDLASSIEGVDRELADCRKLEKLNMAAAVSIDGSTKQSASDSRAGIPVARVSSPVPPGIGFIRMLRCRAYAMKHQQDASLVARQYYPNNPEIELAIKTAVLPGDTTTSTWATELVYAQNLTREFIEVLMPLTVIPRLTGITMVPFNVRVPKETSTITAQWVGEGQSKPVLKGAFDTMTLRWAKLAAIMGFTDELARFSDPSIEMLVRNNLARGIAQFIDQQFLDPNVTEVANISPAAITQGASNDPASGIDQAAVLSDVKQAFAHLQAANIPINGCYWIMEPNLATGISMILTPLGQPAFPSVNTGGGSLFGVPVVTSNNCPSGQVTLVHAPSIFMADDGGISVDVSREASVQMDDNPTSGDYQLVSAFQNNLVFVRAERYITWKRARDEAVYYITSAAYGGTSTV